jgi:hypothetical protein
MSTTITSDRELLSPGYACQLLRVTYEPLMRLVSELGIEAAEVRDGVCYYTANDIEKIRQHLEANR